MEGAANNTLTFQITSNLDKTGPLGNRQTVHPFSITRRLNQIQIPPQKEYQQQTKQQVPETTKQTG